MCTTLQAVCLKTKAKEKKSISNISHRLLPHGGEVELGRRHVEQIGLGCHGQVVARGLTHLTQWVNSSGFVGPYFLFLYICG